MSFDWVDYLHLAKELNQIKKEEERVECRKRSAVSRAYYAAFQVAFNLGFDFYDEFREEYELEESNSGKHEFVSKWFEFHQPRIGLELKNLRIWRNQCDYDNDVENLDKLVEDGLNKSNKIIEKIQDHKKILETFTK